MWIVGLVGTIAFCLTVSALCLLGYATRLIYGEVRRNSALAGFPFWPTFLTAIGWISVFVISGFLFSIGANDAAFIWLAASIVLVLIGWSGVLITFKA